MAEQSNPPKKERVSEEPPPNPHPEQDNVKDIKPDKQEASTSPNSTPHTHQPPTPNPPSTGAASTAQTIPQLPIECTNGPYPPPPFPGGPPPGAQIMFSRLPPGQMPIIANNGQQFIIPQHPTIFRHPGQAPPMHPTSQQSQSQQRPPYPPGPYPHPQGVPMPIPSGNGTYPPPNGMHPHHPSNGPPPPQLFSTYSLCITVYSLWSLTDCPSVIPLFSVISW